MALSVLGEKVSPAKKTWKRLISTLQSKLHRLKTLPRRKQNNHHHHYYYQHERNIKDWHQQRKKVQQSGALICMDKPFEEIKDVDEEDEEDEESTFMELVLYGVDARAQDFIDKARRQLALERQESEENLKAMLARGM